MDEAKRHRVSVTIEAIYEAELVNLPERYLADRVTGFLSGASSEWRDDNGSGRGSRADLGPLRAILGFDDLVFGSSRMIELVTGNYMKEVDYRVAGAWTPASERQFHATAVDHASVVGWVSASEEAARRKAMHFRSVVGEKARQLHDRPGILHVGYETTGGNAVEGLRHHLNMEQMRTFDPRGSTLEWVYGNYMMPEHTTARMESAALTETTATYSIKGRRHRRPTPDHMLFLDDEGSPGSHWLR